MDKENKSHHGEIRTGYPLINFQTQKQKHLLLANPKVILIYF